MLSATIRAHAQSRGACEFTGQQVLLGIAYIHTSGAWELPSHYFILTIAQKACTEAVTKRYEFTMKSPHSNLFEYPQPRLWVPELGWLFTLCYFNIHVLPPVHICPVG